MKLGRTATRLVWRTLWPLLLFFLPTLLYAAQNYADALSSIAPADTRTWDVFHAQLLHMFDPANIAHQWGRMFLLHWRISPVLGVGMLLVLFLALRLWYIKTSFSTGLLLFVIASLYQEPGYILLSIMHLYLFS